jgi:hypothetical protein
MMDKDRKELRKIITEIVKASENLKHFEYHDMVSDIKKTIKELFNFLQWNPQEYQIEKPSEVDYKKIVEEIQLIYGQDEICVLGQKIQLQDMIIEYIKDPKFKTPSQTEWVKLSDEKPDRKKVGDYVFYKDENNYFKRNKKIIVCIMKTDNLDSMTGFEYLDKNKYWQKITLPDPEGE